MNSESEKYQKVLKLLKESNPDLDRTQDIEREVMNRIIASDRSYASISDIIEILFGWIYIGWVRRSLIAASAVLVVFFVYQQSVILRQINALSNQVIITERGDVSGSASEIGKRVRMYKISGRKFPSGDIKISDEQIKQLLESVNEMQVKYKDLLNLIEDDPELKEYVEKKLLENNRTKFNL
jgi:hypothetical protein